jgi:SAM-dependent methyltransferase
MNVFRNYSKYYDLLYQDKDYNLEAKYIIDLLKKYSPNAQSVLELGCGTGKHAYILAENGYSILGIDNSKTMLYEAKKVSSSSVKFRLGDARNFRANQKFDAVISLFHVASYQTTNDDLINYFKTANAHLDRDGIFIFDCWYGPAVLNQKPEKRIKELENEDIKVKRCAIPEIHIQTNTVDINYVINIQDKKNGNIESLKETHSMRYLFTPEIELFIKIADFKLIDSHEWLSGKIPSDGTWSVSFIVRAI